MHACAFLGGCVSICHSDTGSEITPGLTTKVDGIQLNYERLGSPKKSKPTLLLVHGFGASLQTWHDVFPILASDFPVVRLDLKGSGFSDKPDDQEYQPIVQAKLLAGFLSQLPDDNFVLVGHSYGGEVVLLTYLYLRDEEIATRVRGIVLVDAAVYPQKYPFFVAQLRNPITRFVAQTLTSPTWRSRYVLERVFANKTAISEARINRYAYFLRLPGAERALKNIAEQVDSAQGVELAQRLREIDVPVLVLWGAKDPVIPLHNGHRLQQALRGSHLEIIGEAGHVPHEESPKLPRLFWNSRMVFTSDRPPFFASVLSAYCRWHRNSCIRNTSGFNNGLIQHFNSSTNYYWVLGIERLDPAARYSSERQLLEIHLDSEWQNRIEIYDGLVRDTLTKLSKAVASGERTVDVNLVYRANLHAHGNTTFRAERAGPISYRIVESEGNSRCAQERNIPI